MSGASQDNSEDQKSSGENNTIPPAQFVNRPAEEKHAKNLTDEKTVRHPGLHARSVVFGVKRCEHRIHVAYDLRVVAVGEESEAADDGHENRRSP